MTVDFKIYLITDRKLTAIPLFDAVHMALKGGVRAIQLREKDLPVRKLLALALDLRRMTNDFNAKLFINDRVDVAIAADADGVHLGHESMPVEAVRQIVGDQLLIGVSTHSADEAKAAEKNGADFVTFGPIYDVPRKGNNGKAVGIELLTLTASEVGIPIFGLGGVHGGNAADIIAAGAAGIAMITGIFRAENIENKARELVQQVNEVD